MKRPIYATVMMTSLASSLVLQAYAAAPIPEKGEGPAFPPKGQSSAPASPAPSAPSAPAPAPEPAWKGDIVNTHCYALAAAASGRKGDLAELRRHASTAISYASSVQRSFGAIAHMKRMQDVEWNLKQAVSAGQVQPAMYYLDLAIQDVTRTGYKCGQ